MTVKTAFHYRGESLTLMLMEHTLTQPELGILYVEMAAPLHFHKVLQHAVLSDEEALNLHQTIADQKPDTALITLGLCGVILANYILKKYAKDQALVVLATELKYFSIDVSERYGRAWINARDYEGKSDKAAEEALLLECPENLNAYGSIVQELHEICEGLDGLSADLGKLLEYQAYAQANIAESYVEMLAKEGRLPGKPMVFDPIPLPRELQPLETA